MSLNESPAEILSCLFVVFEFSSLQCQNMRMRTIAAVQLDFYEIVSFNKRVLHFHFFL